MAITVNAVNDAPVNTVPGAQSVDDDTALGIGGVAVKDVDSNRADHARSYGAANVNARPPPPALAR